MAADPSDGRQRTKHKRHAPHAPELECIGNGKARKPPEFGVKVSLAISESLAQAPVNACGAV